MFIKRILAAGLAIGAVLTAIPAHAGDCAMRDQVVERLAQDYAEQLTGGGLNDAPASASVIEVWASPETGTFTVIQTGADGMSCILATGTDWFARETEARPTGLEG